MKKRDKKALRAMRDSCSEQEYRDIKRAVKHQGGLMEHHGDGYHDRQGYYLDDDGTVNWSIGGWMGRG